MVKGRIALTFKENGQNGGPYISHKRVLDSFLSEAYDFIPLTIPRARCLLTPWGMNKFVEDIKNCNADAVQIAGLQLDGILTMYACKKARVKTIVAVHGRMIESPSVRGIRRWLYDIGEKWTINNANATFGVSDYVSSWDICKNAPNYCGTIYNLPPKAKKMNESNRKEVRRRLGLDDNDVVFVSTGRIIKEKGYDILWEAIKRVDVSLPIKYVIVGDGSYLQLWKNEVLDTDYEKKIIFAGYQKEVDEYLSASDAFIICTKHETLCISLLEAGMHSLPLIGTNVGGIPEIIEDDYNGILVEKGDITGFANAIKIISKDKVKRIKMGENANRYVSEKFLETKTLKKLDVLYQKILGEKCDV